MNETKIVEGPSTRLARPGRSRRWISALLVVLVFVCGLICGAGATAIAVARGVREAIRHPERRPERGARWLARKLALTPQQHQQVLAVLHEQSAAMMQIRDEVWPRVRERILVAEAQIASILTPPQQEKWRTLTARLRERWLPAELRESREPPR